MKKLLIILALSCLCVFCFTGFTVCEKKDETEKQQGITLTDKRQGDVERVENEETVSEFTVQVVGDLLQGVTLSGGEITQTVSEETPFTPITVAAKYGYNYLYYVADGKKYCENVIDFGEISENKTVQIVCEYATDELPVVNINTDGAEINSKEEYVDMTFSIENCDDELTDISGGIRLRGNTTRGYDKKPYRIKFDKKQSLFGLESAKSWVLLADYLDPSCLHNYTALSLGNTLDGLAFTPTPHHVNVYLNGEYVGLYVLCEQVQENKGRIDIEKKITADMTELKDFNFFISMDKSVLEDATAVLDETYFYLSDYDRYIELKYPEKSDFKSEEQFNCFFAQLKEYVKSLFDGFYNKDTAFIEANTNLSSLIDYLIIDEIMGEKDHASKSFNMYYVAAEEKLSFGPIWDYDWCLFTPWTNSPNTYYTVSDGMHYSNIFYQCVRNTPELYSRLKARYNEISSTVLGDFIDGIMLYEYSIAQSLNLNAGKWYTELDEDITRKNVIFLNKFLLNRKRVLDSSWAI